MSLPPNSNLEWLETDGLGGFASGTATGIRTRRYHALLLTAITPPTGRMALVNGFDAWVETAGRTFHLSSHYYTPGVVVGEGATHIVSFKSEPWPHWTYKLESGTRIKHEIFVPKSRPMVCISWKVLGPRRDAKLFVRPFLSGRDYHSLHKNNPTFLFDADLKRNRVSWSPYNGVPAVAAFSNAKYSHQPLWYYGFLYEEERARGLDCEEDLAGPGVFSWDLANGEAALILTTKEHAVATLSVDVKPLELLNKVRERELKRRERFGSRLEAAADNYIVERHFTAGAALNGERPRSTVAQPADPTLDQSRLTSAIGETIIAGYPWFSDWGRDTFIAMRGLCLATGRFADARNILLAWTDALSEGMLPNRFPDNGEQPEFNAVDASLWFIVAAYEYLQAGGSQHQEALTSSRMGRHAAHSIGNQSVFPALRDQLAMGDREKLLGAVEKILKGYSKGTRYGIHLDSDGLLAAGERGAQLTWMDAKVGEWVVTQRAGKPVEVQALWLNALKIASQFSPTWADVFERGLASFRKRFWNEAGGCLYDVVDVNHQPGEMDAAFRPNQILAVGGLPFSLLETKPASRVVAEVEKRLWTPLGLRSLAPGERDYKPRYTGGAHEREGAYHQGTVWPWLIGPFVEAWVRVRGGTNEAKREARGRFLAPILAHLGEAGLGHISEIADAEAPHTPRGCPFQAWSLGEVIRLDKIVLAESKEPLRRKKPGVASRERPVKEHVPA